LADPLFSAASEPQEITLRLQATELDLERMRAGTHEIYATVLCPVPVSFLKLGFRRVEDAEAPSL
jgi:hypothetical protein